MSILKNATVTNENNQIVVTVNCDGFIIPNHGGKIRDGFLFADEMTEYFTKVAKMNGTTFDTENDTIMQVWLCNEDSDNIVCHGAFVEIPGENDNVRDIWFPQHEYFLSKLFKDKKEGDVVSMEIPVVLAGEFDEIGHGLDATLHLNIKLSQQKYRYRGHGTFEEVYEKVNY